MAEKANDNNFGDRGKWSLLKNSLVGSPSVGRDSTVNHQSIHRHQGFDMFHRNSHIWIPTVGLKVSVKLALERAAVTIFRKICSYSSDVGAIAVARVIFSAIGEAIPQCVDITEGLCRIGCGKIEKILTAYDRTPKLTVQLLFYPPPGYFQSCQSTLSIPDAKSPENSKLVQAMEMEGPFKLAVYSLNAQCQIFTRERPEKKKISLNQLFAHRLHGVDNTGNVRVWFSEQVLLYCLLQSSFLRRFGINLKNRFVLELGGGMTGLAGIGVAAGCPEVSQVVITDGNPEAVLNQQLCVQLNEDAGNIPSRKVSCRQLLWDKEDKMGVLAQLKHQFPKGFDLIVAADCLFFEDFHQDLKQALSSLLAEKGQILLLQPSRGGSLQRFVDTSDDIFKITQYEQYDEEIYRLHQNYLQLQNYTPDIHFPLLLHLKSKD